MRSATRTATPRAIPARALSWNHGDDGVELRRQRREQAASLLTGRGASMSGEESSSSGGGGPPSSTATFVAIDTARKPTARHDERRVEVAHGVGRVVAAMETVDHRRDLRLAEGGPFVEQHRALRDRVADEERPGRDPQRRDGEAEGLGSGRVIRRRRRGSSPTPGPRPGRRRASRRDGSARRAGSAQRRATRVPRGGSASSTGGGRRRARLRPRPAVRELGPPGFANASIASASDCTGPTRRRAVAIRCRRGHRNRAATDRDTAREHPTADPGTDVAARTLDRGAEHERQDHRDSPPR